MTQIVNILDAGMILEGTSECGRVVTRHNWDDARLDGRLVVRGYHTDANGSVDRAAPVSAEDWALVVATMRDVSAAYEQEIAIRDKARFAKLDAAEARLDGIEMVRGGAYDPHAY